MSLKRKLLFFSILPLFGCNKDIEKESVKKEILAMERSFESMTREKGIAEAFYFFADDNAIIKRQNDTLITGKNQIGEYYRKGNYENVSLTWTPDFIDVSDDGTLGYTYGKYRWVEKDNEGDSIVSTGIFHTIWKRQPNGIWKYVWD